MDKFTIDKRTRIIARRDDGALLATNHPSATFNDIYEEAVIIDNNEILSPILPIGSLTKVDDWEIADYYFLSTNIIEDSLFGFAVGDAFGVPVETLDRDSVRKLNLKDMTTGVHNVLKGTWSDDTSMVIATMESISNNNGNIDYDDIMNNFIKMKNNGEYTSTGVMFDIGSTTTKALNNYIIDKDILKCGSKEFLANGNGSLMRILPFSLYCIMNNLDDETTKEIINTASSLTHAHDISKMGCYIYTEYLRSIISMKNPFIAFESILEKDYNCYSKEAKEAYSRLLDETFVEIEENDISSKGYIVDTLESMFYSIINSDDFESSILTAVNLGNDTDTIAALTGSITAIIYKGVIPQRWQDDLVKKDYLTLVSNKFNEVLKQEDKVKKY